jgi:hypothetical protein
MSRNLGIRLIAQDALAIYKMMCVMCMFYHIGKVTLMGAEELSINKIVISAMRPSLFPFTCDLIELVAPCSELVPVSRPPFLEHVLLLDVQCF